jgi:hypothetical protein
MKSTVWLLNVLHFGRARGAPQFRHAPVFDRIANVRAVALRLQGTGYSQSGLSPVVQKHMKTIVVAGKVIRPRNRNTLFTKGDVSYIVLYDLRVDPKTAVTVDTADLPLLEKFTWSGGKHYPIGYIRGSKGQHKLLHHVLMPAKKAFASITLTEIS